MSKETPKKRQETTEKRAEQLSGDPVSNAALVDAVAAKVAERV